MCKSKSVFLLKMDNGDESDVIAEDLGISLHAVTDCDVADMRKLHIQIHNQTLMALVDIGSTHTFIKETVVAHLGLLVTPRQGLTVKVTNDERVASQGVCKEADMMIGDEHFTTNLYMLPLDDFNIVLNVHWLRALGPIMWDFDALTMSFWRQRCTIQWIGMGISPPHCSSISVSHTLLDTLLESFSDLFNEPRGLPPVHRRDHHVRLLPGTAPVAIRLYRYP
jgi:hypothetical protein